jgi:hypothetical protein
MNLRKNIIAVIRLEPFERETFTEIYRINRESHNYPCNDAEKEQQFVAFVEHFSGLGKLNFLMLVRF